MDLTNQTWNRYAYVNNNPLINIDPLGLFCLVGHCGYDDGNDSAGAGFGGGTSGCDLFGVFCAGPAQGPMGPPNGPCFYVLKKPCGRAAANNAKQQTPQQKQQCAQLKAQAQALSQQTSFWNSTAKPFLKSVALGEGAAATAGCVLGGVAGGLATGGAAILPGCGVGGAAALGNSEIQLGIVLVGEFEAGQAFGEATAAADAAWKQYSAQCQ